MNASIVVPILIFLAVGTTTICRGQARPEKIAEEINFQSIKEVLKNDFLQKNAKRQERKIQSIKEQKVRMKKALHNYPKSEHFWNFFSELWLVRNVQRLKWDFKRPDYGLEKTIVQLFEKFGFFEQKFKLLLSNDFSVAHLALPANPGETFFVLSLPFIRTTDLTKREIAVLLLEDYIRLQMGYFQKYVTDKELEKFIGGNFSDQEANLTPLNKALERANYFIFERGFNFQQQFKVTQRMSSLLRSDSDFWAAYLSLLGKIDKLVKSNQLYQNYTKIYPAPEIQMKWVLPKKKLL